MNQTTSSEFRVYRSTPLVFGIGDWVSYVVYPHDTKRSFTVIHGGKAAFQE